MGFADKQAMVIVPPFQEVTKWLFKLIDKTKHVCYFYQVLWNSKERYLTITGWPQYWAFMCLLFQIYISFVYFKGKQV